MGCRLGCIADKQHGFSKRTASSGGPNQIFNFLKEKRGIKDGVCQQFKDERMDFTAVRMATDGDLQALGSVCGGDILALR